MSQSNIFYNKVMNKHEALFNYKNTTREENLAQNLKDDMDKMHEKNDFISFRRYSLPINNVDSHKIEISFDMEEEAKYLSYPDIVDDINLSYRRIDQDDFKGG